MTGLTDRQLEVLRFIAREIEERGYQTLAEALTGEAFELICQNGAPAGENVWSRWLPVSATQIVPSGASRRRRVSEASTVKRTPTRACRPLAGSPGLDQVTTPWKFTSRRLSRMVPSTLVPAFSGRATSTEKPPGPISTV